VPANVVVVTGQPQETGAASQSASAPAAPTAAKPALKPRLELYVPSVKKLLAEVQRSRLGMFADHLAAIMRELSSASSEGVDAQEFAAVIQRMREWPDVAIDAAVFAPDREGQARWIVQLNMPVQDLRERLHALLETEAAQEVFADILIKPRDSDGYAVRLPDTVLGYLLPVGRDRSCLTSHPELSLSAEPFRGAPETDDAGPSLLVCRLNLTQTEKDSGETFLSKFSVVTAIDYLCRVNEAGDWTEEVTVYWPPVSGMALKALFGRVKQTFFVPDEAFGSAVFNTMMLPSVVEQLAGFGPQVMLEDSGDMAVIGEATGGPIAAHARSEACLSVLPGTGFLPAPDIVIQCRAKHAEGFVADARAAVEKANKAYREREQPEPWHEVTVRDRTVFWRDSTGPARGMMMPLVMRPVVFVTKETDAKDRQRDFVVVGWTSTSPDSLVRRWLDLPRPADRHFLPQARKTNGELWVNWRQVYQWLLPYLNLSMSVVSADALLPGAEEAKSSLSDGRVAAKVKYAGLAVSHQGPVPLGVLALPTMVAASMAEDRSGRSDLARERLACERLKVLYHHAKLFRKDVGRWPAEVAELDGYVDFAGNPHLLQLRLSSRKAWRTWFEDMFEPDEEEDPDQEDELYGEIDDDLYVIEWGSRQWSLGIAPGTLEHLHKLYIDQEGLIHRVEKKQETESGGRDAENSVGVESAAPPSQETH
jgi:hypothetical protein